MKAIILAGGESSRFGKAKAFCKLIINILSKIIETLKSTNMFNRIIISTTNSQLASQFEYEYVIVMTNIIKIKGR